MSSETRSHVVDMRNSHIEESKLSFCGKKIEALDWHFLHAYHAISSIQARTYAQPCKECVKAMIGILNQSINE